MNDIKTSTSIRGVAAIQTGRSSVPRRNTATLDIFLLEKEEERLNRQDRVFMTTHAKIQTRIKTIRSEIEKREAMHVRTRETKQQNIATPGQWKKIKLKY
jgi:hypothetical protein